MRLVVAGIAALCLVGVGFAAGWITRESGLRVNGGDVQQNLWEASPGAIQPPHCKPKTKSGIGPWDCIVSYRTRLEDVRVVVKEDGSLFGKRTPQDFTACCIDVRG